MKEIRIVLEDKEAEQIQKIKGKQSWKELLLSITKK